MAASLRYLAGLDLGQPQDFTALAIVEKTRADPAGDAPALVTYAVRHLERFPLGTAYAAVFDHVLTLVRMPPLRGAPLIVDQTGVGTPVLRLLRRTPDHPPLVPVTLTAGFAAARDAGRGWLVPKLDLVGGLQVLLQNGRLKVAESLAEARTLVRELTDYRVKPLPAQTTDPLAAWRDGQHDDLVFAVALAVWHGERQVVPDGPWSAPEPPALRPAWARRRIGGLGRW